MNIEEYVSSVIDDRVACFMNVQAFILEDTDFINSRGEKEVRLQLRNSV